ncbi:histidine utilization repressor [Aliamphritea ceti]|uniref:histidine utilization repressor n=1 Tax=Aliamphritea ceti TaxID=1524258 RepID=UPI0021C2A706|nr:histidine utilization repressor [Aliamphritea ceti]
MRQQSQHLADELKTSLSEGNGPLYEQLKQAIASRVRDGSWVALQRVPSEAELVKALDVSRMTANRALRELTSEGILQRQQGVGTFVAEKKLPSALSEIHDIAEEIDSRGNQHRAEVLCLERAKASQQEALGLGVRTMHPVYRSVLLHFENQLPIQLESRVINAELAPEYLEQDFTCITPSAYLSRIAPLTEGEHLVEAVLATPQQASWLQMDSTEPCLQIQRRTWSRGELVASAQLLSPGSRFQLFGHFGRNA